MNLPYTYIADLVEQVGEFPEDSILSRTIYDDDHLKVVLFGFAVGQELSEHTASMPAIIHILQGEARLTVGDDVKEAAPGTWVHMEANLPHSILAKTPTTMLLMMMKV